MITTRNRAEQVLGMMCSGKKKEKTLWYCSYELAVFRRHYLQCGQFTPIREEADFCLLVTKPFQQGGVFYDVELPEGRHGLFQAMNEKELMFEIARLMECNILEREDTAVAVRRTDIMRVVSSLLTYSGKDGEWKATLSEYRSSSKGRVFHPEDRSRAFQYLEVHHPGGFSEVF